MRSTVLAGEEAVNRYCDNLRASMLSVVKERASLVVEETVETMPSGDDFVVTGWRQAITAGVTMRLKDGDA